MRREIDRLQRIVHGFTGFSRDDDPLETEVVAAMQAKQEENASWFPPQCSFIIFVT
ncbi:MAG: hypothetical protein GY820_20595 [Gammaproteobacteria bacterium]|nr:hypothetical protein [Gammaproteobacteria bacterium]